MLQAIAKPVLAIVFVVAGTMLAACQSCEQRTREQALALALPYAASSFNYSTRRVSEDELIVVEGHYERDSSLWHFEIASKDRGCAMTVAVPDCDPMESTGGGCDG